MSKPFYQEVFNSFSGFVYEYKGTIPDNVDPLVYITEQFAIITQNNQVTTSVVEIPRYKKTVLYTNTADNLINHVDFELVTDLWPDPAPTNIAPPAEDPPADPAPTDTPTEP